MQLIKFFYKLTQFVTEILWNDSLFCIDKTNQTLAKVIPTNKMLQSETFLAYRLISLLYLFYVS